LRLSRQRNDAAGLVLGHYASGLNLLSADRFASSRTHLEEVLALYDPISHRSVVHQTGTHPQVVSQGYLGIVLLCLGFPNQALARSNAAIAEARRLAHPPSLVSSLAVGTRPLWFVGDTAALDDRAEQLIAVATEQGFPHWRAMGTRFRGWVKVKNGDLTGGLSLLRSGLAAIRATGAETGSQNFLVLAAAFEIAGLDRAGNPYAGSDCRTRTPAHPHARAAPGDDGRAPPAGFWLSPPRGGRHRRNLKSCCPYQFLRRASAAS
jgi:predicted ATPase